MTHPPAAITIAQENFQRYMGINYFPLTASDYQCKEELRFTLRPLPNACKLEGDLWKFFWTMVVAAGG